MSRNYDVAIVGARCAGAAAALLLARRGYRVLLVDRAKFPSDIAHGHLIHRGGPRLLKQLGVLKQIEASGCKPCTSMMIDFGSFQLTGRNLVVDDVAVGYGPRRIVLDKLLVDAATAAGAELRENFFVEEYLADDGRVAGIRGKEGADARSVAERAWLTIGADGRNSRLARAVGAREYHVIPTLSCWYFSYWSGVESSGLEMYVRERRAIFAFPTNDGLFGVFVAFPIAEQRAVQAEMERQFMAVLELAPALAERIRAGRREERFRGAANLPNFFRKPYGPGWALVGDAGSHKDPYLALGIADALRDANFLADAIDDAMSGRTPAEDAMERYEQLRNDASLEEYRTNAELAQFKPPSEDERALLLSLRGDQAATDRFFMTREGMIAASLD